MTSPLFGAENGGPSATTVEYIRINSTYLSSWTGTENFRSTVVGSAFTLSTFYIQVDVAPGAGKSYTFTVLKNGAATSLEAIISDSATSATDNVNSVVFAAGDTLSLRSTPSGTPTVPSQVAWNYLVTAPNLTAPLLTSSGSPSSSATSYSAITGGHAQTAGWNTTESSVQIIAPTSGTISNFYARVSTAPSNTRSWQFTIMKNGVASALDLTIANTNTTNSNTSGSVSVAAGDMLSIRAIPTGTPTSPIGTSFGLMFTPTTPGESFFGYGSATAPAATTYENVLGAGNNAWVANEANRLMVLGPYTLKKIIVGLVTAPGAGTSRTIAIRKAGVTTALAVTIADANTTGTTTADVTYTQGETITLASTVSGSPAAATGGIHMGALLYATPTLSSFVPIVMVY